jgi:hypothetical protein
LDPSGNCAEQLPNPFEDKEEWFYKCTLHNIILVLFVGQRRVVKAQHTARTARLISQRVASHLHPSGFAQSINFHLKALLPAGRVTHGPFTDQACLKTGQMSKKCLRLPPRSWQVSNMFESMFESTL